MNDDANDKAHLIPYAKPELVDFQKDGLQPHWKETFGDCAAGYAVIDMCTAGSAVAAGCVVGGIPTAVGG